MHSLPLNPDKKQTEWEIIQSFAKNNNFPQHLLPKLKRQILHKVNNKKLARMAKQIWTKFTFHSPKIRKITNLLTNTNIGLAFKTTTTLHHLIKPIASTRVQEHEKVEYKNYAQDLPKSVRRADKSKHKIKIPGTHTVH